MTKSVSVIIPTLDRGEVLLNTLKDLLKQKYSDFEIIVVDQTDRPKKEVLDFIKAHQDKIKYIHLDKKGSPHARNVGVNKSTGEVVLFLDDDVEIKDIAFIESHLDNYEDKNICLVGGRVIDDLNRPNKSKEVGRLKYWGLKEITNFDSKKKMEIDHAAGGNFSCYKEVFLKAGGFGEIYKGNAHMEETDFCLRVKRLGDKLIFEPSAVLHHLHFPSGGNRRQDIYEFRYWLVHNSTVFYLRNYPKILFPLFYINKTYWILGTSIKRKDYKMFKVMISGIKDGVRYYNENSY